jgi:CDP-paratose 2-epimerase
MKEPRKRKLLVTGSTGLVGSAAVTYFAAKDWEVIGIDNNGRSKFFGTPKREGALDIDITDEGMVNWLFNEHKFDAIIHAAAQPSHDWAKDHVLEDFKVNALGTLHLLEATRKYAPNAVFVHVSTDKVYGENMSLWDWQDNMQGKPGLIEKETRLTPFEPNFIGFNERLGLDFAGQRSLFGCSKTAADVYAQEYANYFGMKVGIFRPGCITGSAHAGAEYHGFLAYLTNCIKHGKTYKIFGHKGKQVRDQIHAFDLVSAFNAYISNPISGAVYNIGGGPDRSISVLEAGAIISKTLGKPFLYEFHEERKGDRVWDVHDVSKFRRDYPEWDYQYSLTDIIEDLCQ